ncbi:MAG: SPOR domain-containing protein [Acidobacteriota bacterium]|nr:SPOR domain-containing protein [Acidobacteriota bacterium]
MNEAITGNEQQTIEHKFRLGAILRRKAGCSIFETEFQGSDGTSRPAVIRICEFEEDEGERLVARWRRAMELEHPNLLKSFDAGVSRMGEKTVAYLVTERADEALSGVLSQRALSPGEVRELVEPALSALEYLHARGYAHNGLKASNVFAAGDRLKVATDRLLEFGEGVSAEEDVRALGALLLDAMTSPGGAYSPKAPFGEVVRCCIEEDVSKRWTLGQVRERLDRPESEAETDSALASPAPRAAVLPRTEEPESAFLTQGGADPHTRPFPKWVAVALTALVAAVALGALMRKNEAPRPAPSASSVIVQPAPRTAVGSVTSAEPSRQQPQRVAAATGNSGEWFVIVAAYGSSGAAEKRVHNLASRWPGFPATVVERPREKARYLVVLGQRLSQTDAKALKAKAVRAGLPRDTYIKRLG